MSSAQEITRAIVEASDRQTGALADFAKALDRLASIITVQQGVTTVTDGSNLQAGSIDLVNVNTRLGKLEISVAKQEIVLEYIKVAIEKLPKSDEIATLRATTSGNTKGQSRATDLVLDVVKWLIIAVLMYVWTQANK